MARKLAEPPGAPLPAPPAHPPGSAGAAREELLARGALHTAGHRSDPLADAKAARAVVAALARHEAELRRRGLTQAHSEAALALAAEIEMHLATLPATALAARERSAESAELLAEAAATAQAARDAVARVARGPRGAKAARAFGLGEPCNARRPAHVLRALRRLEEGARAHPEVAADLGLLEEDRANLLALSRELSALPGARAAGDEGEALRAAQGGLRAFFDLVAAKATLALSGDPDERIRLLSLLPRAEDRRHGQRAAERARG